MACYKKARFSMARLSMPGIGLRAFSVARLGAIRLARQIEVE